MPESLAVSVEPKMNGSAVLLELRGAVFGYGSIPVTEPVELAVRPGECFGIVGANGAGKSTLLRAVAGGGARVLAGEILFAGRPLRGMSGWRRTRLGMSLVPEGRELFGELTVAENITAGALRGPGRGEAEARAYDVFPQLGKLRNRRAAVLSGGEQQMLAVARALAGRPRLMLLDEPSLGLSPRAVGELTAALRQVTSTGGTTILVVEQSLVMVRELCQRAAIMQLGRLERPGPVDAVLSDEAVREGFLRH